MKRRPDAFKILAIHALKAMFIIWLAMILFIFLLHLFGVQSWPKCNTSSFEQYISWKNPAIWVPLSALFLNMVLMFLLRILRRRLLFIMFVPILVAHALFVKHNMYIMPVNLEKVFLKPQKNIVYSFLNKRESNLHTFRIYPVRLDVGDGNEEILYPCINEVYGIRSLAGYGPLFHKHFDALTHIHSTGISYRLEYLLRDNRILSMLNVKYLLLPSGQGKFIKAKENIESTLDSEGRAIYREIFKSHIGVRIYENSRALPYAYSIPRFRVPSELKDSMHKVYRVINWLYKEDAQFDPHDEALFMGEIPEDFPESFAPAKVELLPGSGTNRVEADVESKGESFIIFSELFYPGWRARLDGKKVKLYRANVILFGIRAPPGRHHITLTYLPSSFIMGAVLSVIFCLLLVGAMIFWDQLWKGLRMACNQLVFLLTGWRSFFQS
jgi:hypothetical protein